MPALWESSMFAVNAPAGARSRSACSRADSGVEPSLPQPAGHKRPPAAPAREPPRARHPRLASGGSAIRSDCKAKRVSGFGQSATCNRPSRTQKLNASQIVDSG